MARNKTQVDLVKDHADAEKPTELITETVRLPGIESLHLASKEDIADVLANFLKSRAGIVSFKWTIGQAMEVVSKR